MNTVEPPIWLPPPPAEPVRRSHKGALLAVLGAGVAAGVAAAVAFTGGTGTSGSGAGSPDAGFAASQSGSATGPYGARMPRQAGTVTAVDTGRSTVTIKTATGTATYAVDGHSDIDKNGEASLGALKAGDAVTFSTVTTNGKATIAVLHSGDEAKNRPAGGGFGFGRGRLDKSGTVSAVNTGNSTVTIKTAGGTASYAVDGQSDIDKNGEASLGALKAGDAVTFSTVTTNGKATIAILHSGDESKNRPSGGFGGHGGGWAGPSAPGGEQGAPPNG